MKNPMENCKLCSAEFNISEEDFQFYQKAGISTGGQHFPIPPPSLCPQCRTQRKLVWRSELHLCKRTSDRSGKSLISHFSPLANCVVYSQEEFLADDWNPLSYGRDYDFSKSFFEQFKELLSCVPLPAISNLNNENSPYINNAFDCKNCYLIAGSNRDEDCYYGTYLNDCKDCVDNCFIHQCELCYECIDCKDCYNLNFGFNSFNCRDSWFLHNCRACTHCFGSVNLRHAEFVFFNQQLSEEEYWREVAKLALHTHQGLAHAQEKFEQHRLRYPYPSMIGEGNENVSGNLVYHSKNSSYCFDVTDVEDCKYCTWFHQSKDCMDCYSWGLPAELCYECISTGDNAYHNLFCSNCYNSSDVYYSLQLKGCKDCFGCISLRNKQYCILNKQYSKEEYETLLSSILKNMSESGEWGKFFPMNASPFFYNQTIAQDYFPADRETAVALGANWAEDENQGEADHGGADKVNMARASSFESISDLSDTQAQQAFICAETGKPYRIIAQELRFYREKKLPPPIYCPEQRHVGRLSRRLPRHLWSRQCDACKDKIETAFSDRRQEIVFCGKCYHTQVYHQ